LEVLFRARAEDRKRAAREIKEIKASAEAQVCNARHASAAHCFRYHHLSTIQFIIINIIIAVVRYCVFSPLLQREQGVAGVTPPWGVFLKDYQKCEW